MSLKPLKMKLTKWLTAMTSKAKQGTFKGSDKVVSFEELQYNYAAVYAEYKKAKAEVAELEERLCRREEQLGQIMKVITTTS